MQFQCWGVSSEFWVRSVGWGCAFIAVAGGREEGKGMVGAQGRAAQGAQGAGAASGTSPPHLIFLGAARAPGESLLGREGGSRAPPQQHPARNTE